MVLYYKAVFYQDYSKKGDPREFANPSSLINFYPPNVPKTQVLNLFGKNVKVGPLSKVVIYVTSSFTPDVRHEYQVLDVACAK